MAGPSNSSQGPQSAGGKPGEGGPGNPELGQESSRLQVEGSVSQINDYFYEKGWTDGLPVIPPTEDLVLEMLEACPLPGRQVLGRIPPLNGTVTVEKVAINAVMAGSKPDYFPVVLAAVTAVLQPEFNAGSITTTTGGAAPAVIVSGPIAEKLGIHGGTAVFGSGHRANATIGRALRLTMRNLGGATADTMEKSTHGWPGKYTMCFAENQERNPWEPLHVAMGYPPEVSTVTVVAARGIHTMVEGTVETGEGVLDTLVGSMTAGGISGYYFQARHPTIVVVLGPEHATQVAASGFSRADVINYLFEHVRIPAGRLRNRYHFGGRSWPEEFEDQDEDYLVPLAATPDHYLLVVAGGDGSHSSWLSPWSATQRATEVIGG